MTSRLVYYLFLAALSVYVAIAPEIVMVRVYELTRPTSILGRAILWATYWVFGPPISVVFVALGTRIFFKNAE